MIFNCCHKFSFRIKIPDVTEKLRRYAVGRTLSSNLVYTIWTVFGGFILHFLLCNYLTVLLRPSYEEPVETAADLIKRKITPFLEPSLKGLQQVFWLSADSDNHEIAKKLFVAWNLDEFAELVWLVNATGEYAQIGRVPSVPEEEFKNWYRSSQTIKGLNPYGGHFSNKKWPLKKVLD